MKRPPKKPATDRSFVIALSRGLDVLRAFRPSDGLLGNQEIAARTNLPKPTISRLTYTLTKLGYLTPVPRFEKYQLAPAAMALGYSALANMGIRHLSDPYRDQLMRETGGAVAIGARDRLSMIYFGQSRSELTVGVLLDVGSKVPIATTAMGRAYLCGHCPRTSAPGAARNPGTCRPAELAQVRDGIERAGECVAKYGFAMSARRMAQRHPRGRRCIEVKRRNRAVCIQLRRSAFKFSEVLLKNDIGPRLVAMVRNIEVAMTGTIGRGVQGKEPGLKKLKQTGEDNTRCRGSGSAFNCMQRHLLRAAGALAQIRS
jgi:DNA-binding IclR family transcriptional regulator